MDVQFSDVLTAVRGFASQAEAELGINETKAMNPLRVKQAITALTPAVAGSTIREALKLLAGVNRLPKSAIWGADFTLNYQGTENISEYVNMGIAFPAVLRGDFWIHDGSTFTGFNEGDWIVALNDDATFEDSYTSNEWLILPFGNMMTIAQIVTGLEALSGGYKLNKSAIQGGEWSLNRRGTGDLYNATYKGAMTDIMKGDFWIMYSGGSSPESDTSNLLDGDWVVAVKDGASTTTYSSTSDWLIIRIQAKDRVETLSNKRITPRVLSITSAAQPEINTDLYDAVTITALAENITSMSANLSGTPNNFDRLTFRIANNSSNRDIAWNYGLHNKFEAKGVALPTRNNDDKVLTVQFIYDTQTSKWGCISSVETT